MGKAINIMGKKIDHKISCIGYQHNILSHNNYSIFQSLNENYQPDKILCSNYPSYKILKKKTLKGKDKISLIGNLNLQSNLIIKSKENKKFILVAPEGIETENIKLFKFSLKCAKQNPQIKFYGSTSSNKLQNNFEFIKNKRK